MRNMVSDRSADRKLKEGKKEVSLMVYKINSQLILFQQDHFLCFHKVSGLDLIKVDTCRDWRPKLIAGVPDNGLIASRHLLTNQIDHFPT